MDTTPAYELDLVVGSPITVREEEDRETYEEERAWLQEIQEALATEGVEVDLLSQPGTEVWEGGIEHFADLYQLRRLAVHLERGNDVAGVLSTNLDEEDEIDPLLADVWEGVEQTRFPHLVNHQGDGGYYLPGEFDEPIWMTDAEDVDDEEAEAISFGSAKTAGPPSMSRNRIGLRKSKPSSCGSSRWNTSTSCPR